MNSVHPEKNGYTNGNALKMEDVSAGEVETEAKPNNEAVRGKTSKEVQLEQVPRMGQPRDGCRISRLKVFLPRTHLYLYCISKVFERP